jgi:hypothetical protein
MLISQSRRSTAELVVLVASPTALVLAMVTDAPQPWRATAAAVFFLLAPGVGILAPLRLRIDLELALTIPVSLAVTSLAALPLFYLGTWSGGRAVALLVIVCACGALIVWARPMAATAHAPTLSGGQGNDR